MANNLNKTLVLKKNKIYLVSYMDEYRDYYEFYCIINSVVNDYYYFTVTSFARGNENNKYKEDVQMIWNQSEFNSAYVNEMAPEELLEISRCKTCAKRLFFIRTALCCAVHGRNAGF